MPPGSPAHQVRERPHGVAPAAAGSADLAPRGQARPQGETVGDDPRARDEGPGAVRDGGGRFGAGVGGGLGGGLGGWTS